MSTDPWEDKAEDYERRLVRVVGQETLNEALEAVDAVAGGERAGDFGCGTGLFTRHLARGATHVVALDTSESMLDSARRKLTDLNNVQFVHASCLHTGLEDATLDTVLMANVLQMVSDRHAALAEASRVLRPGGRLLILAWTATGMSLWGRFKMMWHYLRQMGLPPRGARNLSPDQAQELTQANGFDVDEMKMLGRNVKCMFMRAHKPREEPK